jgi:heat shock protein HtpX
MAARVPPDLPAAPGASAPRAPAAGNLFDEQRRNRRDTWLLIGAFVALLAVLGLGFDLFVLGGPLAALDLGGVPVPVPVTAAAAILMGTGSAFLSYRFGDRAVLASSGARPVGPDDASPEVRRLMNVATEMAIAAGIPMPRVHLVDDPDPNAFATGRDPEHASIAVTTGLLQTMSRDELQGVVAHEMAHVRNYDIRKMTVVAALLGAVLLVSDWAARLRLHVPAGEGSGRSGSRRKGGGPGGPLGFLLLAVWILAVVLAPLIGRLLATAVSRRREYLADASGAELTRNPLGLAGALRKLEAATAPTARIHRGTAHLCIADPLGREVNERTGWLADLFATHPPIAERVARLEAMAYRRGP